MSDEKKAVLDMIAQIRFRLDDLEECVNGFEGDLAGYAKKLDKVDDRIFLIEEELEKANPVTEADDPSEVKKTESGDAGETEAEGKSDNKVKSFIKDTIGEKETAAMKEAATSAAGDIKDILVDGKAVAAELQETYSDFKSLFGGGNIFKK